MEWTAWRQMCDRGRDLVLCLDFPGGRAAAGFAELAAGIPADMCFLHIGRVDPAARMGLDAHLDEWVGEVRSTGRRVRGVLGFCSGTALATRVADAVAATAPGQPPAVLLFDAMAVPAEALPDQFVVSVEASAAYLADGEMADARQWSAALFREHPDDLPFVAAALSERYAQLISGVVERLSLGEFIHRELTDGFSAYMAYLLLAVEGGLDMRTGTPVFVSSRGHALPAEQACGVSFDVDHDRLMCDTEVLKYVAGVLSGE